MMRFRSTQQAIREGIPVSPSPVNGLVHATMTTTLGHEVSKKSVDVDQQNHCRVFHATITPWQV